MRMVLCLGAAGSLLLATVPNARTEEVPEKYRETVRKGLDYLVKQQFKDGHWGANGDQYPVSMTGLAGVSGGKNADSSPDALCVMATRSTSAARANDDMMRCSLLR